MKKIVLIVLLPLLSISLSGQYRCQELKANTNATETVSAFSIDNKAKSDTIDILHYDLHLDFTDVTSRQLGGHCDIRFTPKLNNVSTIGLDLLMLQIDSIVQDGQVLSYSYNDTIIRVNFATALSSSDTSTIKVYYHGSPQGDGSNWGGWHSQSGYYFNLGVGFAADPHTYGRAWFPCFDNFVEKSTYDFHFTTVTPFKPYANGIRQSETVVNGDTILTHWQMTNPIPTYLASVAISNYAEINDNVNAANGNLPIQLMAKPADSLKMINSFVNLKPTLLAFEDAFGPYYWQKLGYAVTTVGAMEHATSIHYPVNLVNGNLSGEDIMAHELAHHWWGNLVTCETDEHMWINEGMAEYSSHLYTEDVYGRERYLTEVMNNAYFVLDQAHIRDDGFKAIQGLSHEYVYGAHVYQKGAMVGHNLRAYLGDSTFFNGLTTLLQNNRYGNLNSSEFRDQLSQITGQNLTDFFDGWVFEPGFPQFSVDSFYSPAFSQNNTADVQITQRLREAPAFFKNVPVFVTFFSESGDTTSRKMMVNGRTTTANFQGLPFKPIFAMASYNGKLLSGNTYDEYSIKQTGALSSSHSQMDLSVNSVQDSAKAIVMHHWAGPGGKTPQGQYYRLSPQHFWTVGDTDLDNADITAKVTFRKSGNTLDKELVGQTMDSITMLYRKDATEEWRLYPHQNKTTFGVIGNIELDQLKAGDYVLANTAEALGVQELEGEKGSIEIYPNPAKDKIKLQFNGQQSGSYEIEMVDASGKILYSDMEEIAGANASVELDISGVDSHFVVVSVNGVGRKVAVKK